MVRFPVATLGSRRMGMASLTASIPVKVPAPMLKARMMMNTRPATPTAPGKHLDQLRVARRDDKDGEGGGGRDEDAQRGMIPEREKRLLGTVRRRRQAVGTQPDPCQQRDEGELAEQLGVPQRPGAPDQD